MPTKTIVIGEDENQEQKQKIQFEKILDESFNVVDLDSSDSQQPKDFEFIELICKNYAKENDLIFAYDSPTNRGRSGCFFIGKWNDGVV